jgi:hypothetical protein
MAYAKQNTAKLFLVGPILDADGVAVTSALTATDVLKVTKNGTVGAADAQDTMAHSHTGHYIVTTDGGDFDTLGEVTFSLNSGTNAMAERTFQVLPATVYDALVTNAAGGANGFLLSGANNKALVSTCDTVTAATLANGAHGGAAATLTLLSAVVNNSAGVGVSVTGSTTGITVTGTAATGVQVAGATHGVDIAASAGPGVEIDGTTFGMQVDASAGPAVTFTGTTFGIQVTANNGPALSAVVTGGNAAGVVATGYGSGEGIIVTGGATGEGLEIIGGATSGSAMKVWANGTNDVGLEIIGLGSGAGVKIDAGATGIGLDVNATSGSAADFTTGTGAGVLISGSTFGMNIAASAGDGIQAVGAGGGYDIDADIFGTITAATTITTYTGNTPQTADSKTILDMLKPLSTTVLAAVSTSSFTLTDGSASASAYVGMLVKVTDAHAATLPETRRIITYAVTTKTVTVDRAFSFTPTAGDTVVIGGYGNVSAVDSNEVALANVKTRLPQ